MASVPFSLEQLRIFVAVAQRQHVSQAARDLNMAQSAVSAAIAALEARFGTPLFHRVGRGIRLVDAGQVFLGEARAVLDRAEAAQRVMADMAGLGRGQLVLMASQTIASYWLPRHIVAFRSAHPGIDISLRVGNTAQVATAVHDGAVDLGFVEGMVSDPALDFQRLARDMLVMVAAPHHPLVAVAQAQKTLPQDALQQADWVMREKGSGTRSELLAALCGLGLDTDALTVALELPSNEAVRAAVEAGGGITALSACVVAGDLEAGLLNALPVALPPRDFTLVRHGERPPGPAARALIKAMAES